MEGNGRGGRKSKGEGRGEVGERFGPPKNFGVAPSMDCERVEVMHAWHALESWTYFLMLLNNIKNFKIILTAV